MRIFLPLSIYPFLGTLDCQAGWLRPFFPFFECSQLYLCLSSPSCSTCIQAVCWYVTNKDWRAACCFSKAGWNWKTAYICWNWECSICLPANRSSVLAACDEQAEQYTWGFGDPSTSLQACILICWLIIVQIYIAVFSWHIQLTLFYPDKLVHWNCIIFDLIMVFSFCKCA